MDCIKFEGKVSNISLLTHADKLDCLKKLFAKTKRNSDVFLPDDSFYGEPVSAEDPERMANILFKWLGIKHRSLSFHVDPDQDELILYEHAKNSSKVTLGWHCLEDSLVCGAAVAHAIVHHLIIARAKISLGNHEDDESLTDLGTIYAGFGLVILNSFESQKALGSMGEANYASEFKDYCSEQRIVDNIVQPYILPAVSAKYMDKMPLSKNLRPFIKSRLIKIRNHNRKLVFAVTAVILAISGVFIFSITQPNYLTDKMQTKKEEIALLRSQFELCQNTVKRKQTTWDQSDIFIQRQIDADKTRCTSLKNRYNYEVNDFNSKL